MGHSSSSRSWWSPPNLSIAKVLEYGLRCTQSSRVYCPLPFRQQSAMIKRKGIVWPNYTSNRWKIPLSLYLAQWRSNYQIQSMSISWQALCHSTWLSLEKVQWVLKFPDHFKSDCLFHLGFRHKVNHAYPQEGSSNPQKQDCIVVSSNACY